MNRRDREDLAAAKWLGRALCCRYVAATFRSISVNTNEVAGANLSICWSLGTTEALETEILGVWVAPSVASSISDEVFSDLEQRGVEEIRILVSLPAAAKTQNPLRDVGGPLVCKSLLGARTYVAPGVNARLGRFRRARQEAALAIDEFAEPIDRQLRSAVKRHGLFSGREQALVFVASFLQRLDRRLETRLAPGGVGRSAPVSGVHADISIAG